jgi:hypothetical protein
MLSRTLLTFVFVVLLTSCASPVVPNADEVIGEWQKPDDSLPPINLVLSRNEGRILARLRLSGVEANGTASVEGTKLRLTLPGREDMAGEFLSKSELKLRLDTAGPEFVLKRRD